MLPAGYGGVTRILCPPATGDFCPGDPLQTLDTVHDNCATMAAQVPTEALKELKGALLVAPKLVIARVRY